MSREKEPDEDRVETVPTGHGPDEAADEMLEGGRERNDVVSDPALDDHVGSDWVDEGGATPDGPATTAPEEQAAD